MQMISFNNNYQILLRYCVMEQSREGMDYEEEISTFSNESNNNFIMNFRNYFEQIDYGI